MQARPLFNVKVDKQGFTGVPSITSRQLLARGNHHAEFFFTLHRFIHFLFFYTTNCYGHPQKTKLKKRNSFWRL